MQRGFPRIQTRLNFGGPPLESTLSVLGAELWRAPGAEGGKPGVIRMLVGISQERDLEDGDPALCWDLFSHFK